jgi:hypothetical protein
MEVHMLIRSTLTASALAAALISLPLASAVHAESAPGSRPFIPDDGRINRGGDELLPSASTLPPIPSQEDARAALMTPDPGTISTGEAAPTPPATVGAAPAPPAAAGPIGSTFQTAPAKVSKRNDVLDRVPLMAWPVSLDEGQRRQLYQAVMADNAQPVAGADKLAPAMFLSYEQTRAVRAFPPGIADLPGLSKLAYVKAKDKVLLVRPDTGIVVDQVTGS